MKQQRRMPIPNGVFFVMDYEFGILPESMEDKLIASTPTCIAVGAKHDQDGDVLITLTNEETPELPVKLLRFDRRLSIPSKRLSIVTINNEELLTIELQEVSAEMAIWVDHEREPSEVIVVVKNYAAIVSETNG